MTKTEEEMKAEEDRKAAEAAAALEAEKAAKEAEKAEEGKGSKSEDDEPKMSDAEARLLKEQMKTKERLKAAEAARAKAEERLSEYEGVDPAKYRDLLDKAKAAETAELERKGEYKRIIEQVQEEAEKRAKDLQSQVEGIADEKSKLEAQIERLTVGNAFAGSGFIRDKLVLSSSKVQALYASHFDIVDGKLVPFDKPRDASDRTPLVDGSGEALNFEAALEKIITSDPDYERMAKSTTKPGANSRTTDDKSVESKTTGPASGFDRILAGLNANSGKK